MRTHAALIMFIGAMAIAVGAVLVLNMIVEDEGEQGIAPAGTGPELTGVIARNIDEREADTITLEVSGGDEAVRLNETFITLTTENSSNTYTVIR